MVDNVDGNKIIEYLNTLGLSTKDILTQEALNAAKRTLAKKYHPDNKETGERDKFEKVMEAFDYCFQNLDYVNKQIKANFTIKSQQFSSKDEEMFVMTGLKVGACMRMLNFDLDEELTRTKIQVNYIKLSVLFRDVLKDFERLSLLEKAYDYLINNIDMCNVFVTCKFNYVIFKIAKEKTDAFIREQKRQEEIRKANEQVEKERRMREALWEAKRKAKEQAGQSQSVNSMPKDSDTTSFSKTTTHRVENPKVGKFSNIVSFILLVSIFVFLLIAVTSFSAMWPFLIVMGVAMILLILYQTVFQKSDKRIFRSGIVLISIVGASFATAGGLHIGRAVRAQDNYCQLKNKMMNFDTYGSIWYINRDIRKIPSTYGDVRAIKSQAKDLENYIENYGNSRARFKAIYNFDLEHDNWNCSAYFYNYSIESLILGAVWSIDESSSEFIYYRENGGLYLHNPGSKLPNNMKSYLDYYFYTVNGKFGDTYNLINGYIDFGYESKTDKTDKFLAYRVGPMKINKDGKFEANVYCYSNKTNHTLTYKKEYTGK